MPRDGSSTRNHLLDIAESLVIENGFAGTSVDQVLAAAGASKGSFFHHFPSKADLARALVERYAAADVAHLRLALDQAAEAADDPSAQLVELVRVFEESADELMSAQSSCLYVAVLTERQLVADGTSAEITAAVVAWREGVADLVRRAYATLRQPPALDADALADHVFVTFEGAFLLCRTTGDPAHMRAQLGVLRQLVEGLLAAAGWTGLSPASARG